MMELIIGVMRGSYKEPILWGVWECRSLDITVAA
jgi:hypothetical protein